MNSLKEKIQAYIDDIQATSIENFQDKAANIEMFRVKYLGKKGIISELFEQFKTVPNEEKKDLGKALNLLKSAATEKIE
ncbi:MAG: phenylalanine--tRNA ligase subunit alpha, partial [Bacteroidales bacterium]|nr:phenylalanine--tRNA ligase subunit alpha [Bacteroidales bacterium]